MSGKVLFDGTVDVHYQFIKVHDADTVDAGVERGETHRGQTNGLCGAARAGVLDLVTGLHTGEVGFSVELHPSEPAVSVKWEDIVEVSFTNTVTTLGLHGFQSQELFDLPPGQYRVRYCARGMDIGQEEDTLDGDDPVDFYLLQFWAAPPGPDSIVREGSEAAGYWHHAHAGRPLTGGQQHEDDREAAESRQAEDYLRWGDRVPNARLRAVDSLGEGFLETLDMDAVFALSEADDSVHRQIAAWAALRAIDIAGFTDLPAMAPAVAALRRGEPVPPPFDDSGFMWSKFANAVPRTTFRVPPHGDHEQCHQDWTIPAIFYTARADSLTAAYAALTGAASVYGMDYPRLFTELRQAFPQLDTH